MANATELLRAGKRAEIWDKYCGFLDMDIAQFMHVQDQLLLEQLPRLGRSELGRKVMGGAPRTIEEFRASVPLTTYREYGPYLLTKREDVLPEKPYSWVHTSGRSGEYDLKWIPCSRRLYELGGEHALACFILAAARRRGEIRLREGMSFLYTIAPPPYISGLFTDSMLEEFAFGVYPPVEKAKAMDYQVRLQEAFRIALTEGLDYFYGVTSILLRISEQFSQQTGSGGGGMAAGLTPRAVLRLARAAVKALLSGRKIQPRDIWNLKGALCGGMDTSIFRDKVAASWGIEPLEAYGCTEFGMIATEAWNKSGMSFFPNNNYWEFIPEAEYRRMSAEPGYRPKLLRMNEVQRDQEYVLVGTNFHGGTLARYVLGDLIRFVALENREAGIRLPQMVFVSRIDGLIDIGGFTRLTEPTIWRAIEASGVPYVDWTIRKESSGTEPVLHLYLEPKGAAEAEAVGAAVHERLKALDTPYRELEAMTGLKPLKVSLLSSGTFRRYFEERQAAGADLAFLKPPHVNASDGIIDNLLHMSSWKI